MKNSKFIFLFAALYAFTISSKSRLGTVVDGVIVLGLVGFGVYLAINGQ